MRDIMRRELELATRELELARGSLASVTVSGTSHQPQYFNVDINILKDMLNDFEGEGADFRKWRDKFQMLQRTYKLSDDNSLLLMGSKLKGNALRWFHSESENTKIPVDGLLKELRAMFDHRQDRMTLGRKFEGRSWKSSVSLKDYLVDGIPNASIMTQL